MTETAKLTASDGLYEGYFGQSVAISGDTIVVGRMDDAVGRYAAGDPLVPPGRPSGGSCDGAVYVFVKPTEGWTTATETAQLTADGGINHFGASVAISGDTVVVGAAYQSFSIPYGVPGAVYVFVKPSAGWTSTTEATAKLMASDQVTSMQSLYMKRGLGFGESVAISGDTIAVGMAQSWNGSVPGAVYMFVKPDSGWATMIETAKITLPGGSASGPNCSQVALGGDRLVVVADWPDAAAKQTTYVFVKPQAGWTSDAMSPASFDSENSDSQTSTTSAFVAISGNAILAASSAGTAARVFTYDYDTTDTTAPIVELLSPLGTTQTTRLLTVWARHPESVSEDDPIAMPDGTPVWLDIDLNGDGDFADAGEAACMTSTTTNGGATFMLSLTAGTHKVRARVADLSGNVGISDVREFTVLAAMPNTIGLFDPKASAFYLRNTNTTGFANLTFGYGPADGGWTALSGDWDGDGVDTIGLFDPTTSTFYLRNSNDAGFAGVTFAYGPANSGWIAIAGDWNGDGADTVGLYDPKASIFYLRDTNTTGIADTTFAYGPAHNDSYGRSTTWTPIAGDWNGDGRDTIALYDPTQSVFYLRNSNDSGFADVTFSYGPANSGWTPIAGDWNGDGLSTVGLYAADSSVFYLVNANESGYADVTFAYGPAGAGWTPVVGDWGDTVYLLNAAAGETASAQDVQALTQSSLAPTVQAAIARWASAGLGSATIEQLSQVQFVVADLPGDCLGKAEGNTVYIDANAAGHGWFIDPTPANDEEFTVSSDGALQAIDARAIDQIDLLTVVEHELGHIAGFADLDATIDNVMDALLPVGLRRTV
jgi:hypothetical protein